MTKTKEALAAIALDVRFETSRMDGIECLRGFKTFSVVLVLDWSRIYIAPLLFSNHRGDTTPHMLPSSKWSVDFGRAVDDELEKQEEYVAWTHSVKTNAARIQKITTTITSLRADDQLGLHKYLADLLEERKIALAERAAAAIISDADKLGALLVP